MYYLLGLLTASVVLLEFHEIILFSMSDDSNHINTGTQHTPHGDGGFVEFDMHPVSLLNQNIGSITRLCSSSSTTTSEEEMGLHVGMDKERIDGNTNTSYGNDCFLLPQARDEMDKDGVTKNNTAAHVNSPMPVRILPWMTSFQGYESVLYYSSNVSQRIHVLGTRMMESSSSSLSPPPSSWSGDRKKQQHGKWNPLEVELSFDSHLCQSLHSPSIYVNDKEQLLHM